jgi:DNA modification methylase
LVKTSKGMKNVKIGLIKPYEKNAKKHPAKQIKQVAESIKAFGFNQPIVVDKNGVIIVGHGRYEAAKLLGLKDVPAIKVNLTDEQAKAYRLADNKLNESEWDMGLAIEELKGLSDELIDLTGFDRDLLIETDEKDDILPDNAPTRAKLGDVWQLGRHRIMCGDSTDKASVERLMDGKKADMVFTDPPYGISIVKHNQIGGGGKLGFVGATGEAKARKYRDIVNDETTDTAKKHYLLCLELGIKKFILWGGNYFTDFLSPERGWIIWDKKEGDIKNTFADCELAWTNLGKNAKIFRHLWAGLLRKGGRNEELKERVHPTQKPVGLLSDILLEYTKEDDIVFDAFLGSGSTLIATEKTGRICYGMELDPKYTDVILKRWEDYTGGKAEKISV